MSLVETGLSPAASASFPACSVTWWRSMWAVTKKEAKIFVRYPSWIVALVVWPILLPMNYIFGSKALAGPAGQGLQQFARLAGTTDYTGFMVIGSALWMWVNMTLWDIGGSLRREQMRGTLESNWLTPTARFVHLLGAALFSSLVMMLITGLSLLSFRFIFGLRFAGSPWFLALVLLVSVPSIGGLGILFASLVVKAKNIQSMVEVVRGAMMVLCGVTYPLAVVPGWLQGVAWWIPLTHSVNAARAVMIRGAGVHGILPDLIFLLLSGAVFILAGVLAFHAAEKRSRLAGTLGTH